jgi:hypothetical protein
MLMAWLRSITGNTAAPRTTTGMFIVAIASKALPIANYLA